MNKYNKSGYKDLTAYNAIKNATKKEKISNYLPLVYICSPYRGDTKTNAINARKYSRFATINNCIPIAPHLLFPQFLNDKNQKERKLAMHFNYVLLGKCSEVWVFGDKLSEGMAYELSIAKKRFMKIRYFNIQCEEVFK